MGRQHGSAATVTNFHTDSRASLRSAAGSSACPRCAAGRYAAGTKKHQADDREAETPRCMIINVQVNRWEGGDGPTLNVSSALPGVKGATRRFAMASGHP